MKATMLFPSDYYSLNSPNVNFSAEVDAVVATDGLEAAFFNFDDYIEGGSLALNKPVEHLPKLVIYRGWMMKPEQYRRFHSDLVSLGLEPLVSPLCTLNGSRYIGEKGPTLLRRIDLWHRAICQIRASWNTTTASVVMALPGSSAGSSRQMSNNASNVRKLFQD